MTDRTAFLHIAAALIACACATYAAAATRRIELLPEAPRPFKAFAVHDLDGDGARDVVVAGPGSALAAIRVRDGADVWRMQAPARIVEVSTIHDADGDGTRDLLITDAAAVRVLSGRSGAALFALHAALPGPGVIPHVSAAPDLDGDGTEDLMVGMRSAIGVHSGRTGAPLADAAARLAAAARPAAPDDAAVAAAASIRTPTGDAIAVASLTTGGSRLTLQSAATPQVRWQIELPPAQPTPEHQGRVADAGDVDGDGHGDLLVVVPTQPRPYVVGSSIRLVSGADGRILFRRDGERYVTASAAGDVDGDGHGDLLVVEDTARGEMFVWSGGAGRLLATHAVAPWPRPVAAASLGDADGDGRADFLVGADSRYYVLYDDIPAAPAYRIDRRIDGPWFNRTMPGQGLFLQAAPEHDAITVGWFTYFGRAGGTYNQARWFSGQGTLDRGRAEVPLYVSMHGRFVTVPPISMFRTGTLTIDFTDCRHARVRYAIEPRALDGSGVTPLVTGEFDIEALVPATGCE